MAVVFVGGVDTEPHTGPRFGALMLPFAATTHARNWMFSEKRLAELRQTKQQDAVAKLEAALDETPVHALSPTAA